MDWKQQIHLEPLYGWLNDPNGLCFDGKDYHVFFQYSPEDPLGRTKRCWGHFVSSDDSESWSFTGITIKPDIPEDIDGVYSGSAVAADGTIHLFYTGNVEKPERKAFQIHVTTSDGISISAKKVILKPEDYPANCSFDVRDPKVWNENGKWKMVLGARIDEDKGAVLLYEADDPDNWHYVKTLTCGNMGYMWECPDIFCIDDEQFLSLSPQGLSHEEFANQNVYSSGYMKLEEGFSGAFEEYDHGFDFYAPQTFVNEYDERILIGWMGIGDIPYSNPTVEQGRQHCLSIPRKLSIASDGMIRQWPVINHGLYGKLEEVEEGAVKKVTLPVDIVAMKGDVDYSLSIGDAVISSSDGVLVLDLTKNDVGRGRTTRKMKIRSLTDLRVIADRSSIEIFANGGRYVMTSRFYPSSSEVDIISSGGGFIVRQIGTMEVSGFE